ncbi:hypothetical protein AA105894_2823 [Asaia spathodeae NBRC 105894]|nr:hypothetical protein AA105894_2823 [Asaia spathodeae NBRC 105894]
MLSLNIDNNRHWLGVRSRSGEAQPEAPEKFRDDTDKSANEAERQWFFSRRNANRTGVLQYTLLFSLLKAKSFARALRILPQ